MNIIIRENLVTKRPSKSMLKTYDALTFALSLVLKYSVMVIMMTMNGWVNIVLAFGMMFGYIAFILNIDCKAMAPKILK